ncbi:MAG: D-cysteine desulfhydrase family protein [Planctomycetota bacterium]
MTVELNWPDSLELAHLPTPVQKLDRLSARVGREIWVKRDDLTGSALSGNKIRKLDFLMAGALRAGAETVWTCGGIQSNHARATAVAAARLGLTSRLYLRVAGEPPERAEGNVLLDRLVGAEITWVTPEEYRDIDARMADDAARDSREVYVIPEGGSNALGSLGYARAVTEILDAERELGFEFDAVVHACGSGGTLAGLVLGRKAFGLAAPVVAVNVCDDPAWFVKKALRILDEVRSRWAPGLEFAADDIRVLDGYVGPGYARNVAADLELIRTVARLEGLFLDPVYTGKAFRGMLSELDGGRLAGPEYSRVLFIHTGGIYGLFPRATELVESTD